MQWSNHLGVSSNPGHVTVIFKLIELNAVVKPSRREFKSWSWNIYIGIIVLFISFLILYYYFYCSRFYSIYLLYHFAGMRFFCFFVFFCFFFKHFAIYVLNILEYMNRQQQPGKTALICFFAGRSVPSLFAHAKGTIFSRHGSKLVIKTEGVHKYYFFTLLPWVFHVCDRTLWTVCFLHTLHQQKYMYEKNICLVYVWEKFWIYIFENWQIRSTIKCFISVRC